MNIPAPILYFVPFPRCSTKAYRPFFVIFVRFGSKPTLFTGAGVAK